MAGKGNIIGKSVLVTSHILATYIVGKTIGLEGLELSVAFVAGVAIDLDHLVVNRKWTQDIIDFIYNHSSTHGEINQHSWMQECLFGSGMGIIMGLLTACFFVSIRWWIFPLFLLIHILMDAVMRFEHQPFIPLSRITYIGWIPSGSRVELISSVLLLLLVLV